MRPVEWIKCFASVFFVISISKLLRLLLCRLLLLFLRFHHFLSLLLFISSHSIVCHIHHSMHIDNECTCVFVRHSLFHFRENDVQTVIWRLLLTRTDEWPTHRVSVTCLWLWPPYCVLSLSLFIYSWFRYYSSDIIVNFLFAFRFDFSISYGMTFLCTMLWGSRSPWWCGCIWNVFSVHSICPNTTLKINTLFLPVSRMNGMLDASLPPFSLLIDNKYKDNWLQFTILWVMITLHSRIIDGNSISRIFPFILHSSQSTMRFKCILNQVIIQFYAIEIGIPFKMRHIFRMECAAR